MAMAERRREKIQLLVTVKAFPNISPTLGEVVCVAGIRMDTDRPEWARLFPVPFRDLPFADRFAKYQLIGLQASKPAGSDTRPESWLPNNNSLQPGKKIKTSQNWAERKSIVLPLEVESMCEVRRREQRDGTSLAVFRPADVEEFIIEPASDEWDPAKQAVIDQPSLLFPNKSKLEKIPFRFKYRYRCADRRCPTHSQSIIDWEMAAAARNFRKSYGSGVELQQKLRERWLDKMWGPDMESRLFVGNQAAYPESFLVLGVFRPKKQV